MLRQIGSRLSIAIPSLIGVIIVTFLLTRVLPGDPAAYFAGPAATPQAIEEIRKSLGLDRSLPEQFVRYIQDLAKGDFGKSLTTGQSVRSRYRRAAAGVGGTDADRPHHLDADCGAARHRGGGQAGLLDRSCLPHGRDRGRVASGVLHRTDPGLCLLLSARLVARAAGTARDILLGAAACHRLLSDRQPDRGRFRDVFARPLRN